MGGLARIRRTISCCVGERRFAARTGRVFTPLVIPRPGATLTAMSSSLSFLGFVSVVVGGVLVVASLVVLWLGLRRTAIDRENPRELRDSAATSLRIVPSDPPSASSRDKGKSPHQWHAKKI